MKGIIDTHTHLQSFEKSGELENALAAAKAAGIERMITVGTGREDWDVYRRMAEQHAGAIDYTVGLHPSSVEGDWEEEVAMVEGFFSRSPRPVALGEIGLDRFHLPRKNKAEAEEMLERQKAAFAAQLELASKLDCPVVIHSRGAFEECVQAIDESDVAWERVVFHCFSEGPGEMKQLMERGGYGSFTGIITFRNAESVREAAKLQGLERLMIETDAPYLAPMPHRGEANEPAFLAHTARFCAELFGVDEDTLAKETSAVSRRVYGLG